jgi:hypothetical protein
LFWRFDGKLVPEIAWDMNWGWFRHDLHSLARKTKNLLGQA